MSKHQDPIIPRVLIGGFLHETNTFAPTRADWAAFNCGETFPAFIEGVREAAAAGFSFDLCGKHPHLPAIIELVRQCPEAGFILDHGGKPGIRSGLLDPWRAHIRQLAAFPNVVCKLSGLVTEADHQHWTVAQLEPYVNHLLEAFGPGRLLFGGDWPVAKLACGYLRWLEVARRLTAHLTAAEQAAVFAGNAERVYRI